MKQRVFQGLVAFCIAVAASGATVGMAGQVLQSKIRLRAVLTASDAMINDQFGYSVAANDTTVIVGARHNDDAGNNSGSAYLFDVKSARQVHKLTASDAEFLDRFGNGVAISTNRAFIAAPSEGDTLGSHGAVYVFDVQSGVQLRKLQDPDQRNGGFGVDLEISGGSVTIGGSGYAQVFDIDTDFAGHSFSSSDRAIGDFFGDDVASNGDLVVVGAPGDDDLGGESGSVYVFDLHSGQEIRKLTALGGSPKDLFGRSVAISGNTAIIGAPANANGNFPIATNGPGAAYLFDVVTGQQLARLTAPIPSLNDDFGESVAIDGNIAVIGAMRKGERGRRSGAAYVFEVPSGSLLAELTSPVGAESDSFGASVFVRGNTILVGATYADEGAPRAGAVYVYNIPEPSSLLLIGCGQLFIAACALRRSRRLGYRWRASP